MNNIKKSLKTSNGITLIALVITIIVLLILAGISISMLSGDNGILQKATDAKTKSDEAQIQEKVRLAYNSALAKDLTNGNTTLTKSTLEDELKKEFKDNVSISEDGNYWVIIVNEKEIERLDKNSLSDSYDLSESLAKLKTLVGEYWGMMSDDVTLNDGSKTKYLLSEIDNNNEYKYNCYIHYDGNIYKIICGDDGYNDFITDVIPLYIKMDLNKCKDYSVEQQTFLYTPSDKCIHEKYEKIYDNSNVYYWRDENRNLDLSRKLTDGYYSETTGYYYNASGEKVNADAVIGPMNFTNRWFPISDEDGFPDENRPFTYGYQSAHPFGQAQPEYGGYDLYDHWDASGNYVWLSTWYDLTSW